MQKGIWVVVLGLIVITLFFFGSTPQLENLKYDGKQFATEAQLEEYLDNKLELENPNLDLEVDIWEEVE